MFADLVGPRADRVVGVGISAPPGAIYSGVVWVEGTRLPIAVIEVKVE